MDVFGRNWQRRIDRAALSVGAVSHLHAARSRRRRARTVDRLRWVVYGTLAIAVWYWAATLILGVR